MPRKRRIRPGVGRWLPRHIRAMRPHLHALHHIARPILVTGAPGTPIKRRKQPLLRVGGQRLARRPTRLVERLPIPRAIVDGTRQYTNTRLADGATLPDGNAKASAITTAKTISNTSIVPLSLILSGYLQYGK